MKSSKTFRPRCELLGDRTLPSITLAGGVLTVVGTEGADTIDVTSPSAGQVRVTVSSTGENQTFALSQVSRIVVQGLGGNDTLSVATNLTVRAELRGGLGNDTIRGGGGSDDLSGGQGRDSIGGRFGDDTVHGGRGHDSLGGGQGNDDLFGDEGDDDCNGGSGDDSVDGGNGRDSCRGGGGNDDVRNGVDLDTELIAVFTGGQGDAEFKFGPDNGGIEREFEVEVEDLVPNTNYGVFVGATNVGTIRTNSLGDGRLEFELDFDGNDDGALDFPPGFPEITVGTVVTVRQGNGTIVRQGSFVVNPDD